MVPPVLPALPASLKPIQHYLKTASDYDSRDPAIAYWCRLYALQQGLLLDKKSKEAIAVLTTLMSWLEDTKRDLKNQENVSQEIVAQAHIENQALKIFNWADNEDRASRYNKNVVKAFYSAGMLLDVCTTFGELNEDVGQQRKYAKWRAAHLHNCLKTGELPQDPAPKPDEQYLNDTEKEEFGISPAKPSQSVDDLAFDTSNLSLLPQPKPRTAPVDLPTVQPSTFPSEAPSSFIASNSGGQFSPNPEQVALAQKLCKYASSALTYDDVPTAIDNLQKALRLLQTGQQ